jgi:D-xylose transport system substrate-binding protein
MKKHLSWIAMISLVALCATTAIGPVAAQQKKVLGVSWKDFSEERWSKYDKACMLDELKSHPEWEYVETDAQSSVEKQTADVQALISRHVDALVIVPISSIALKTAAAEAVANKIPTIGYDSQVEVPGVFYLSFQNPESGRIQARALLAVKPEGNYVYIKGSPTMEVSHLFHSGQVEILQPYIDAGKIKIVGDQFIQDFNPEIAQSTMEQILTANDNKVDAVVASNDGEAGGVIAALTAQGLVGKVAVSGQDGDIAALNRIAKGFQTVTAWKNACNLGREAVRVAVRLASGESASAIVDGHQFCQGPDKVCQDAIELPPVSITRDNLQVMLENGWITKEQLCAGVDAVPETIHGKNPPAACQ